MAPWVPIAIGAVSSAVQAVGQISQSRSQAAVMDYNARVYERDARQAEINAGAEADRIRRDNARRIGASAAARGASGVAIEGSPLAVIADEAAEGELRALDARYGGLMEARALRSRAAITRAEAGSVRRSGTFAAIGTIVGGLSSAGSSLIGGAPLGASATGSALSRTGYTAGIRGGYGRLVGGV